MQLIRASCSHGMLLPNSLLVVMKQLVNIRSSNPKDLSLSLHFNSDGLCHCFSVRLYVVLRVLGIEDVENIMKLLLTNHLEQELCTSFTINKIGIIPLTHCFS